MAKYLYQILLISTLCLFVQNTSAQESTTGFENGKQSIRHARKQLVGYEQRKKNQTCYIWS